MPGRGTNEGRFLIELDGIEAIRATEVSGINFNHTVTEIPEGNRRNPNIVPGNYTVDDVTIRQAHAMNDAGFQFFQWMTSSLARGGNVERRTLRVIVLDEDDNRLDTIYELRDCLPRQLTVDGHTAGGNNGSFFRMVVRPEDMVIY